MTQERQYSLPLLSAGTEGGVELPTKFSKKGCFIGPQFFEGVIFFMGGWNFFIKNKVKFEIFNN